jgi:hypothetical protein
MAFILAPQKKTLYQTPTLHPGDLGRLLHHLLLFSVGLGLGLVREPALSRLMIAYRYRSVHPVGYWRITGGGIRHDENNDHTPCGHFTIDEGLINVPSYRPSLSPPIPIPWSTVKVIIILTRSSCSATTLSERVPSTE